MSMLSTAAVTAAFLGSAELPADTPQEVYGFLNTDLDVAGSVIQKPFSTEDAPTVQLAQSGEDFIRDIFGAIIRNQLEKEGIIPQTQPEATPNTPIRTVTRDGIENVEDGYVSPNELISSEYVGRNTQTGFNFWDLNVDGYGVVCGAADNNIGPQQQVMQIAQYSACLDERQESPYDNVRIVDSQPSQQRIPQGQTSTWNSGINTRLSYIIEDDFVAPDEIRFVDQIGTSPSRIDGNYYYDVEVTSGDTICVRNPHSVPPEQVGANYVQPVPCRESYEPGQN